MTASVAITDRVPQDTSVRDLPTWPLGALFIGFPLWWVLGIGESAWTLAGVAMAYYIVANGRHSVPKGFGLVLAFLLWSGLSVVAIDTFGRLLGFGFRFAQWVAITTAFVYIYNARHSISLERVLRYLTTFWLYVVAGGYLGMIFPTATVRTPLALILPKSLMANDLVQQMAVRRFSQFNPDAWTYVDPRPSAPFLYTNNWGNAFSLLLPLVILYIVRLPSGWRRSLLICALPISLIPAFFTLNRGMFIGLGVVASYIAVKFLRHRRWKALLGLVSVGLLGTIFVFVLPVASRLANRLEGSGTNESRLYVYWETITRTASAPVFGYGSPRPAEDVTSVLPPAGTQGQVWMVLFSHGFVGLILFLAMLVWMVGRSVRGSSLSRIVLGGVLMTFLIEVFYYGVLGAGLFITFMVSALVMRESSSSCVESERRG